MRISTKQVLTLYNILKEDNPDLELYHAINLWVLYIDDSEIEFKSNKDIYNYLYRAIYVE